MNPREARLAPPSLRRALLLLVPLGLLGTALLGLLAQSASAHDTTLTAPSLTGPVTPGNDTTPSWSFSRPADTSKTTETVDASGATTTVTIAHDYSTECVYDAPVSADQRTQPCGVLFDATTDTFTGGVPDGDGTYALTVRTFESTTRTTQKTESDGTKGLAVQEVLAETYSAPSSAAYVYDGTAPGVTFAEPQPTGPSSNRNPSWSYTISGGGAPTCTLTGPTTATTVSVACTTTGYTAALTTSGTYRLSVTSKDAAGNSTTVASSAYLLDVTPPAISLTPAGETRGTADTHSWSLSVTDGTATRCTLDGAEVACTATITVTRTTDGTSVLEVLATDDYGNQATASASYTRDTTVQFTVRPQDSPSSDRTPTWTYGSTESVRILSCELFADGVQVPGTITCSGTSYTSAELPTTAGTSYVLRLTVEDALLNRQTFDSAAYLLDTQAEALALQPAPGQTAVDNTSTPSWTYSGSGWTNPRCTFTLAGSTTHLGGTCTATGFTAPDLGTSDGTDYVLTVTLTDPAGNQATATATYRLDTTPPTVSLSPAASTGKDTTPEWVIGGTGFVGATCVLTGGGITQSGPCTSLSQHVAQVLEQTSGTDYLLTVTVTDAAGNQATATATYRLDTTPPTVSLSPAASTGKDTTPEWVIGGTGFVGATCVLTGGGITQSGPCTSLSQHVAQVLEQTSGTDYLLTVTVTDAAGNQATATATYRLDTTPPTVTAAAPGTPGNDRLPVFTFATETDAQSVVCTLVGTASGARAGTCSYDAATGTGSFTPSSPLPHTTGETYTFTVTVTDRAGNAAGAQATYRLDSIAEVGAGTAPASPDKDPTPTWTFTSETGATTVSCRLTSANGTAYDGPCTTAGSFTPDKDLPATTGTTYTLVVTVVDALGNTASLTMAPYTLDTVAEVAAGLPPRSPDKDTTPTWTFTSEPGAATVSCRLSTSAGVVSDGPCTTAGSFTPAVDLPATTGTTYTLVVTVVDALGNTASLTMATYRLDTMAELAPGQAPASPGNDTTPTWTFTSEPGAASVSCRLSTSAGVVFEGPCTTAGSFTPTTDLPPTAGTTYTLVVTVVDGVGNTSSTTLAAYRLDTIAELTATSPATPGNDTTPSWTFVTETGATVACALSGPGAPAAGSDCSTGGFTSGTLPATAGADYVLTVTVTDRLGNATVYTLPTYRLDTVLPVATTTVPSSPSRATTVTWTVASSESLTSATCELRRDGVVVMSLASCPGSTTVSLPGDGRYDLVVTLVDLAGNRSTTTSTVHVHDATVPTAPVVTPTSVTTNRTTAVWTVTGEGGTSVTTCRVSRDGRVVQDWTPCAGTFSVALPADGEYLLEAVSTDPVGPGPITTATYLLDTVAPVAPTVTGPTGPAQGRSPSWAVTTETGTTTECRLVRGGTVVLDWAPCSGSIGVDLAGLPDGGYVLEARATDAAQNPGAVGASAPYVLDTTVPAAPVVTGPAGPSQVRTPTFTWSGEPGASAQCQLSRDGAVVSDWVACSPGYAPLLDRDGTWTLAVRLTDAAGNVSEPAVTGGYVLDTTPPAAPVVTPPKTPGRDLAPSWGAVVEGGTTLECRLTGADGISTAWAPCSLPLSTALTGRPDGAYVLEVRATDAAGNLSPVGSGTYVLDTVAPAAAVVTSPSGPGRTRTPGFTFTTEPGAATRCRLTSGTTLLSDFAPCTSPAALDLTGLPDGTYTLTVRVTDAAGNPGPAATGTYALDTTPPAAPVLTLSPASPSPARSVTWAFSAEPGSTLICRLLFPTGAVREIAGCTSPLTVDLTGLPDGSYTLTVRAVDVAGNVGTALSDVHVVDGTSLAGPEVTGPVTPGSSRTPRWTISAGTTECRLTRGTTVLRDWAACSGSFTADLFGQPDGTYVLAVRSRDAAGAVSAAVLSRYVLDTTAPGAAVLVAPPTPSTNRLPTWTVASGDAGATAECRVLVFGSVLQDWAPCAVSLAGAPFRLDLTGQGDGTYTLVVRLTDAAGNRSSVLASSSFVLDTSAPVAVGVTGPGTVGNDVTPTWLLSSGSGAVLECRLTSAAGVVSDWAPCAGEYTADLTGLPDGIYTLAVRAVSAAGTPGPDTTSAYELSTAAPGAPTALALASGLKPTSNNRSPSWTFTLPPGTTGLCRVVQGTRVLHDGPCSSPFRLDLSGAPDGSYTLTVRAVSAAGTPGPAATSTYVLDTVPTSEPVFTQVPGATGSTLDPQWRFSLARGATAQCRLLHSGTPLEDWMPCTSPFTAQLAGRPDGTYVLQVRAVDSAGNTSAPVSDAYLLDRTAVPVATFTDTPPATGADRTVMWTFTAPAGMALECRVVLPDGSAGAWGGCASTTAALRTTSAYAVLSAGRYGLDLAGRRDGLYTLEVRTVDADGRRGAAAAAGYRLDTRPPAMPGFSDVPAATGSDPRPVWLWDAGTDELVECRLVRVGGGPVGDWQECADSQYVADLTRLAQGTYALELRVTDAAGNVSPVQSAAYRYDTTAPPAPVFTSRPPAGGADRTVSWTFLVPPDARATCTVTRDRRLVREGPCAGRYDLDLSGLPDGTYTLTVRFTDAAGNTGASTSGTYALRTLGFGGPVRVDAPLPPAPDVPLAPGVGPGRGGTGVGITRPQGSVSGPRVPIQAGEGDVVRSSTARPSTPRTSTPQQEAAPARPRPRPSQGNPLLPGSLPVEDVPEVLRDVVTGTITRPTLPLALLAIVVLFLLAQNRIDRRDPKLASAPVEAEPELDFTVYIRRPGRALT